MKIIYRFFMPITALLCLLCSCNDLEEFHSSNLKPAPGEVGIATSAIKDSSFVFTLTPGDDVKYYSYVVLKGENATTPDAAALLSGQVKGVSNGVILKDTANTFSLQLEKLVQATTYTIYAVASNIEGVISNMAMQSVTTIDSWAPTWKAPDPESTEYVLTFSEPIVYDNAKKVTVKYLAAFSGAYTEKVLVEGEDGDFVVVEADVIFKFDPQPGDYMFVSWEAGAFADHQGHKVAALTSGIVDAKATGVYWIAATESFDVDEDGFTPAIGDPITNLTDFTIELAFAMDLYIPTKDVGTIEMIYVKNKKTITQETTYSVNGSTLVIDMPKDAPDAGSWISVKIGERAVVDERGNPNAAYEYDTSEGDNPGMWLASKGYTRNQVIHNYTFNGFSWFDDSEIVFANVKISLDPENSDGVVVTGLYDYDTPLKGVFDGDFGIIRVEPEVVGEFEYKGQVYDVHIADSEDDDGVITLTVNADFSLYTEGVELFIPELGSLEAAYGDFTINPVPSPVKLKVIKPFADKYKVVRKLKKK